ncbi:hypothetical protein Tco_0419059 [Tanacetum coccineum]
MPWIIGVYRWRRDGYPVLIRRHDRVTTGCLENLKDVSFTQLSHISFTYIFETSHTVEEIKKYVQKQCDIDDAARQDAIIAVSKLFNKEYHAKQALKEQYAKWKDIQPERRAVIQVFLHDKSMKDLEVEHKLWRAV